MFDIISSRDFLDKLEADFVDYKAKPDSARHALNCIITAYHLHEWVWGDWLKTDHSVWKQLGIRDKTTFKAWLEIEWPSYVTIEKLTNGAKHFDRQANGGTRRVAGFGMGPFGVGPYGRPYLLIDHGENSAHRWETVDQLLDEALVFWRTFFQKYWKAARHG